MSLGVPAVFLFGGVKRKERPQRVGLEHGDVVVWGGPARLRHHGVARHAFVNNYFMVGYAPVGVDTLATGFWTRASAVSYGAAAPYALLLVALSVPATVLLGRAASRTGR